MKNTTISVIALGLALSAQPAFAEAFNGPYVGIEGSHESYEVKAEDLEIFGALVSLDGLSGNGKSGGIYAGYDVPMSENFFVGAEASVGYSGDSVTVSGSSLPALEPQGITLQAVAVQDTVGVTLKARETFGISGRIGANIGGTGVYAKLGYANTRFKATGTENGAVLVSESRTEGAFVYGGGLQAALTEKLSVRAEFTVADYGDAGLLADLGTQGLKVSNSKTSVGLLYRF